MYCFSHLGAIYAKGLFFFFQTKHKPRRSSYRGSVSVKIRFKKSGPLTVNFEGNLLSIKKKVIVKKVHFTITAEILIRPLANFHCQ